MPANTPDPDQKTVTTIDITLPWTDTTIKDFHVREEDSVVGEWVITQNKEQYYLINALNPEKTIALQLPPGATEPIAFGKDKILFRVDKKITTTNKTAAASTTTATSEQLSQLGIARILPTGEIEILATTDTTAIRAHYHHLNAEKLHAYEACADPTEKLFLIQVNFELWLFDSEQNKLIHVLDFSSLHDKFCFCSSTTIAVTAHDQDKSENKITFFNYSQGKIIERGSLYHLTAVSGGASIKKITLSSNGKFLCVLPSVSSPLVIYDFSFTSLQIKRLYEVGNISGMSILPRDKLLLHRYTGQGSYVAILDLPSGKLFIDTREFDFHFLDHIVEVTDSGFYWFVVNQAYSLPHLFRVQLFRHELFSEFERTVSESLPEEPFANPLKQLVIEYATESYSEEYTERALLGLQIVNTINTLELDQFAEAKEATATNTSATSTSKAKDSKEIHNQTNSLQISFLQDLMAHNMVNGGDYNAYAATALANRKLTRTTLEPSVEEARQSFVALRRFHPTSAVTKFFATTAQVPAPASASTSTSTAASAATDTKKPPTTTPSSTAATNKPK